jgi:hypothetical protein
VSDSTIDAVPDEPVNFVKTPPGSASASKTNARNAATPSTPSPALPRTMQLAMGAIVLQIVAGLVRAVSMRGHTAQFEQWLFDTNKKAKKPKSPYSLDPTNTKGFAALTHDLHTVRSTAMLQAIVIGIALVLLVFVLRRVRSAGMGRIALIVITVLTEGPFYVIPTHGWPSMPKTFSVIYGLASILTIILLLMPASNEYFRACKLIANPNGPARGGLGALFGGPRNAGARTGTGARGGTGAAAARTARPPRNATTRPAAASPGGAQARGAQARAGQKAKAREASVAKGADLARTRAKAASKSRKTEA